MNVQYKTVTGTIVGVVLVNTAVILRVVARRIAEIKLTLDDKLMLVALAFHWGIALGGILMLNNGLGLPLAATKTDKLVVFAQIQYAGAFLYTLTVAFTKVSILVMYHRVFAYQSLRSYITGGLVMVVLWTIAVCFTGAFACTPVAKVWKPSLPGTCINIPKFYYGLQIPNILTDVYIVLLPMHGISRLNLPRSHKISLVFIFGLAILTVIFDVIRLGVLIELSHSQEEITLALADTTVWTCLEPAVGITAACLSNLRPLYRWMVHENRIWMRRISQNSQDQRNLVRRQSPEPAREKALSPIVREPPRLHLPLHISLRLSFPRSTGSYV